MTKQLIWFAAICIFISNDCFSQSDIIKKVVEHISHCDNMSYSQIARQKNPFTGEWGTYNNKASVTHDKDGTELYNIIDWANNQYIFNGSSQIVLDLKAKTYQLKARPILEEEPCPTPYYWVHQLQQKSSAPHKEVLLLPDTVIGKANCYHIKMIVADTAANRDIEDFCFDKETYLPVFVKQYMEGKMGEGNANDVLAVMINEDTYTDYHLNEKNFQDISAFVIPADFSAEHKLEPLPTGHKAPEWQLNDTKGTNWTSDQLHGKVIVMDFSFNECAACMVAIPVLKRLHDKYKGDKVKLMSVNVSNTKESVINFIKLHHINYPVLLNGNQLSKDFQISGYPAFYVIDKEGNVAATFIGYNDDLETQLIAEIDKLQ